MSTPFPPIQFTIKNFDLTDSIRTLIQDKFAHRLERYVKNIIRIHLTLEVDKLRHIAKATIAVRGDEVHAHTESKDLYESMDSLIDKLVAQLRKYHDKETEHR